MLLLHENEYSFYRMVINKQENMLLISEPNMMAALEK